MLRFAIALVRAWTCIYTVGMPPAVGAARRAEIESDLWEFQQDVAREDDVGPALHVLLRLLIGVPDDLAWRIDHAAIEGLQGSVTLAARAAGAALFFLAVLVIDADTTRKRDFFAVDKPTAIYERDIEEIMATRGQGAMMSGGRLPLLTAGIVATVGVSMFAQGAPPQDVPLPARAAATVAFEVASIKPNPTGLAGPTRTEILPGGRFIATNMPVRLLIGQAYRVNSLRLVGGPNWIASEHFDINAKADVELLPSDGVRPLGAALQALLADRFKLVVHSESRDLPIYALVLARDAGRLGPNLTRSSTSDCAAVLAAVQGRRGAGPPPPPPPPPPPSGQAPPCGMITGNDRFSADSILLSQLAALISGPVQRPVSDRTGLTGRFNAHLTWTPFQMPQRPPGAPDDLPPVDPNGPSIFTAVQEQLGLKLESTTGPVDVLVIDSVERPTPD